MKPYFTAAFFFDNFLGFVYYFCAEMLTAIFLLNGKPADIINTVLLIKPNSCARLIAVKGDKVV